MSEAKKIQELNESLRDIFESSGLQLVPSSVKIGYGKSKILVQFDIVGAKHIHNGEEYYSTLDIWDASGRIIVTINKGPDEVTMGELKDSLNFARPNRKKAELELKQFLSTTLGVKLGKSLGLDWNPQYVSSIVSQKTSPKPKKTQGPIPDEMHLGDDVDPDVEEFGEVVSSDEIEFPDDMPGKGPAMGVGLSVKHIVLDDQDYTKVSVYGEYQVGNVWWFKGAWSPEQVMQEAIDSGEFADE